MREAKKLPESLPGNRGGTMMDNCQNSLRRRSGQTGEVERNRSYQCHWQLEDAS